MPPKIIQIACANPVGVLADLAKKPILFGLGEDGIVHIWDWLERHWEPLEKVDIDEN